MVHSVSVRTIFPGGQLVGVLALAATLSSCAPRYYAGIPLTRGAISPEIQQLAQRARLGDKQAQFELGMRYEQGVDVPQDRRRAIELYKSAAQASTGMTWVYLPGVGRGTLGRVIPVRSGQRGEGLKIAKDRLDAIERQSELMPLQAPDKSISGFGEGPRGRVPDVVLVDRCERSLSLSREARHQCHAASTKEGLVVDTVMAQQALDASCSTDASKDRRVASVVISPKDSEMIEIVEQLSNAPSKTIQIYDVAKLFGVELINVDYSGYGKKYTSEPTREGYKIELFVLPNQEFRLTVTRLHDQVIADWRTRLARMGWTAETPILHPFMMDSFRKDGKQIRLEHNSTSVTSITVFGLNASRSE